jgi:uncharacterized membrane protein
MSFWQDPTHAEFWLELARGDLATWIQLTPYAYATFEGIHLVGAAFFFGSIVLLDSSLLGLTPRLAAGPAGRFLLRIAGPAFALLAVSGVLLFVPSADRYAASPVFYLKLGAIGVGGLNALAFHFTAWQRVDVWSARPRPPWSVRAAAIASIVVWIAVIALGRGMGYESRQPPAADLDIFPAFD